MEIITETKRLFLRKFTPEDLALIYELNANWEVVKYTGNQSFKSLEEAKEVLENVIIKGQYEKYGMGRWAVIVKETGEFIGWCGIRPNDNIAEIDLGYRYFQHSWGKGYATEAAFATLQYGFEVLNLPLIIGQAMDENIASRRVLEKVGMRFVKKTTCAEAAAHYYEMTKEEWEAGRNT